MFQEEIAELEKGFITLIASVLSKIRAKCVGSDHVLDDEGGKFSEFFLNSAKNRYDSSMTQYFVNCVISVPNFITDFRMLTLATYLRRKLKEMIKNGNIPQYPFLQLRPKKLLSKQR